MKSTKKRFAYFLLNFILGLIAVAVAFWGYSYTKHQDKFPVRKIKVVAPFVHFDQKTVQDIINPYLKNSFFALNATELRHAILQIPWVYSVSIQRLWPDQIAISIEEQTAIAIWNNSALVNKAGDIFKASVDTFPDDLPKLFGRDEDVKVILNTYQELSQVLAPSNLKIVSFTDDNIDNCWQIILDNGSQITANDSDGLSQLQLFLKLYPELKNSRNETAKTIDARYNSGFAVRWQ